MRRQPKIEIESWKYRGIVAGTKDECGLYDLRPKRFWALNGISAVKLLKELVNLPDNATSREVAGFIIRFHNLDIGGTDSGGREPESMTAQRVIELRNLYRRFWFATDDEKARFFLQRLGPLPEALQSPVSRLSGEALEKYLAENKSTFPLGDYRFPALRLNWKTGLFKIRARGPIDWLTHAAFQNRNRLRECLNPNCKEAAGGKALFVSASHGLYCSHECTSEADRRKKRNWKRKHKAGVRAGRRIKGQ